MERMMSFFERTSVKRCSLKTSAKRGPKATLRVGEDISGPWDSVEIGGVEGGVGSGLNSRGLFVAAFCQGSEDRSEAVVGA